MSDVRIALANVPIPQSREAGLAIVLNAIAAAAGRQAAIVCFPECYVPGYRTPEEPQPPADPEFLEYAWGMVSRAAVAGQITVLLGTERIVDGGVRPSVLVVNPDGTIAGFQDKQQLDPSEDEVYAAGDERRVFQAVPVTFGIVICHEGWRYPETVRWAARRGAQVIFHPHFHVGEPGKFRPETFGDPRNSFHEGALRCRAAENTCFLVSVNVACPGSPTTSTVISPDGSMLCYQPYGIPGLLIADLDLSQATRLLATRCKFGE